MISDSKKGLAYAIFTALMWGVLAVVMKLSLNKLNPVSVTWFRFSLAFILLSAYYAFTNPKSLLIIVKPPPLLLLGACFLGFNYLGFISGIHYTSPIIVQVFIQSGALILAISGFLIFKEKFTLRHFLGLLLVLIGFILFYRKQGEILSDGIENYQKGILWTLFGGLTWALYAICQKTLVKNYNPMQLNLVLFGLPALAYSFFANYNAFGDLSALDWGILFYLGANTLLAYGSLAFALKYAEANKVSVVITLNPIITFTIMGMVTLFDATWIAHERFSINTLLGAAIVLTGALLVILKRAHHKSNITLTKSNTQEKSEKP